MYWNRWAEADNVRAKEIERLKADNWHKDRVIFELEDELKAMGARMRILEAKAQAARELLGG